MTRSIGHNGIGNTNARRDRAKAALRLSGRTRRPARRASPKVLPLLMLPLALAHCASPDQQTTAFEAPPIGAARAALSEPGSAPALRLVGEPRLASVSIA